MLGHRSSFINFCALTVYALALITCSRAEIRAEQARIGHSSLSTSYASIWVAGRARLFQKPGIDAAVLDLKSALVRSALLTGEIAMGSMSGTTVGCIVNAISTPRV
ncbi:MAG TPA: hypothetical protein VMT22_09915 [Terriglobales bacterium]|jgi:ABC-type nitrate/sulfonate/bicarbonate transport system substrate-binding protein|nr:hypothetical protein [Terriglobales bacterium]